MSDSPEYYEARGFSVYYFANIIFNVVRSPGSFLRRIEDILSDMRTEGLMRPFHKHTNLHLFIEEVVSHVLWEDLRRADDEVALLRHFLTTYGLTVPEGALDDEEGFADFISDTDRFHEAIDELTTEIFHVLFADVGFLQRFNQLCAGYIRDSGFGEEVKTRQGALRRVAIPVWARRAIFHRDKGECRQCKRSLASVINRLETERYDHIVPLARHGANDVTNLQLLCEPCNGTKSANETVVSNRYQRAYRT